MVPIKTHPDLHVGSNPLGVVRRVTDDWQFDIARTNDGTGKICRVALYGVIPPRNRRLRAKALRYMRGRFVGREARFLIKARVGNQIFANVLGMDLRQGSEANAYLIYNGLATTSLLKEPMFAYGTAYAKKHRLGVWAKSRAHPG